MTELNDFTVQMGGPFSKDKAFWWFSVQRYAFEQDPAGPEHSSAPRSARATTARSRTTSRRTTTLTGSFQYRQLQRDRPLRLHPAVRRRRDADGQPGLAGSGLEHPVPEAVRFELVPRGEVHGYWGYYYLDPVGPTRHASTVRPGRTPAAPATSTTRTATVTRRTSPSRPSPTPSGSTTSSSGWRSSAAAFAASSRYTNGVYFYDYGGPYLAYGYAYDVEGHEQAGVVLRAGPVEDRPADGQPRSPPRSHRRVQPELNKTVYAPTWRGAPAWATFDLTGRGTSVRPRVVGQVLRGRGLQPLPPGGRRLDAVPVLRGRLERFAGTVRRDDDRRQLDRRFQRQALRPRRDDTLDSSSSFVAICASRSPASGGPGTISSEP